MLKECIEIFQQEMETKNGKLVLDTYVPADGTYIIVGKDGKIIEKTDIIKDKKTKEVDRATPYFDKICFYDYNSQLISMNKPVDSKKIIHSNNYLSFFIKKESLLNGKLTDEIIDGYYSILMDPVEKKYKKSKEAVRIYQDFEEKEGSVDAAFVEQIKEWMKEKVFSLEDVDKTRKDYLKIFFEADFAEYEREGRRYFLPNIYNNNSYNTEIQGRIYGIPDNNLGMNAKKPFLSVKTRKYAASYLLDSDQVIWQKQFFDYLMNLAAAGKYHIYVDTKMKKILSCKNGEVPDKVQAGYYFRIRKGKTEAEIYEQDNISEYEEKLKRPFYFVNYLQVDHEAFKHPELNQEYKRYDNRTVVGQLVDKIFFFGAFGGNFSISEDNIQVKQDILKQNMILAKDAWFDWMAKGVEDRLLEVIERTALKLVEVSLQKNYKERAMRQLNLKWSFEEYLGRKGEKDMGEIITELHQKVRKKVNADEVVPVDNDKEYYFCVGQLASYLLSLSKMKDRNQSLLNPIMNAKTDRLIKMRLFQLYKKYNYSILDSYKRVNNLLAMVEGYIPEGKVDQESIMLGYVCSSVVYKKSS